MKIPNMTPEQFVQYVATDYIELSQDKVRIQRNDYIEQARLILREQNPVNESVDVHVIDDNF